MFLGKKKKDEEAANIDETVIGDESETDVAAVMKKYDKEYSTQYYPEVIYPGLYHYHRIPELSAHEKTCPSQLHALV